jgi:hypothetical protein
MTHYSELIGQTLGCGHVLTLDMMTEGGTHSTGVPITLGYSVSRTDDRTMCYACTDDTQRAEFATADTFGAYVSSAGHLTTWSGGVLAKGITYRHGVSRNGWHGSEIHSWRFRADDGSEWYGRNAGPGMCITVRKAK